VLRDVLACCTQREVQMQDPIASVRVPAQGPTCRGADDVLLCACQHVVLGVQCVLIGVVEGLIRHEAMKFLGLR
jgi:hypothetical protein